MLLRSGLSATPWDRSSVKRQELGQFFEARYARHVLELSQQYRSGELDVGDIKPEQTVPNLVLYVHTKALVACLIDVCDHLGLLSDEGSDETELSA